MKSLSLLSLAVAAGLFLSTACQAGQELKYAPKYAAGQTRKTEITTQTKQTLTIAGMPLETAADNFMVMKESVQEVAGDGAATLKSGFDSIQISLKLPGGLEYQFNSANPDATKAAVPELDAVTTLFKAMAKAEWITKSGKDGKVTSVKYEGDGLNAVPEALRGDASEEKLMRQTNQEIARLPGKSVEVGDSWERLEKMDLGSGQIFEITKKYSYAGQEDHNGKPMHKMTSEVTAITYDVTQPLGPLEYKGGEIKPKSSAGTYWFDPAQGYIVELTETMNIVGDLKFAVNGQELPSTLDLTITVGGKSVN